MRTEEKEISSEKLKKWCKGFAIFLIFMWLCTIISKSIYISKLPRVQAQMPDKKYVEHVVNANGIVIAGGELAINSIPGLRVLALKVHEGDRVEEGDLLFCVDLDDLAEIISEKETELKKLKYHLSDIQTNQTLTLQKKEKDMLWAKEDYDSVDKETQENVERARRVLEDAEDVLKKHLETKDLQQTVSGADASVLGNSLEDTLQNTWQQKKESLEEAVRSARQNLEDAERARENSLKQKQREMAGAEWADLADSTAAIYRLDIASLQEELADYYALQEQGGEVRAENAGVVSKIQIGVGNRTMDTAAILLTDAEVPCQFKFSITEEQGKYLHYGDRVKIEIYGNSKVDAEVDYVSESVGGGYNMICSLPENMGQPGIGGKIQKTVQGELHNTVIPIEALYKEYETYYVYVLREKSGILGNELYAEKLKVRVADSNERYAALESGMVGADAKIITYSSEELKQGASVRLME